MNAGGVAVLAALEHSNIHEVRSLSSSTLSMQAAIDARCSQAVAFERAMQERMGHLISELRTTMMISYALEEAMRMVPRPAFLPLEKV